MPFVTRDTVRIHYVESGRGLPLLFVAGFGADLRAWSAQRRAFKKRYRVICIDNRGVGQSDVPPGPYTVRMFADDAVAVMDHLAVDRAAVVGLSMGGMVAQEIAINYPSRVSCLVLAATFAHEDVQSVDQAELAPRAALSGSELLAQFGDIAFNRPVLRLLISFASRLFAQAVSREGADLQRDAVRTHDTRDRLKRIQAPTLVLVGTQDRVIRPQASEIIAASIPGARLVRIQGGSHVLNIEYARQFNRELRSFLEAR